MGNISRFQQAALETQKANATAQQLTKEVEQNNAKADEATDKECSKEDLVKEVIAWQRRYSEIALVNNRHVDIINQLIYFLTMQCGILYTAITGDLMVDDPLKEISPVLAATFDASQEDLHFFRQGIIIYIKKLTENGEIEEAYQDWLKYINAQED